MDPQDSSWLTRFGGRRIVLLLAACLSLPNIFSPDQSLGIDPSWMHSLQIATLEHRLYGRDVIFTYGPLSYLLIRSPVNKFGLLFFDFFILVSLLSIYCRLLPSPAQPGRVILVLALATITKYALGPGFGPPAILFSIAGYWLWRLYADESLLAPLAGSLTASVILFFTKVNFGLLMIGLIPCYAFGLVVCRSDWRRPVLLVGGFALLVLAGSVAWGVDLRGYLRGSLELASGYNEAMELPFPAKRLDYFGALATAFFALAVIIVAVLNFKMATWRNWLMISPFVTLAAWVLFKNAFVRSANTHIHPFFYSLPALLAVWSVALADSKSVKILLTVSVLCGVAQLEHHTYAVEWFSWTPARYVAGAIKAPTRQDRKHLAAQLHTSWPELTMPQDARAEIGRSTVDVMPWNAALALANGLNVKQRPVLQTYAAFNAWLDAQNATFLASSNAPDFILYLTSPGIDARPGAWDESITKRVLLRDYVPTMEFPFRERVVTNGELRNEFVFVLKRSPEAWKLEPISTNTVTIHLNQPFEIPASTNYEFLWLEPKRSLLGKLLGLATRPAALSAHFEYNDGTARDFKAVLPILNTGALVNYRVESPPEIRRWLAGHLSENAAVRSICFKSANNWAFQPSFQGKLVTSRRVVRRLANKTGSASQ